MRETVVVRMDASPTRVQTSTVAKTASAEMEIVFLAAPMWRVPLRKNALMVCVRIQAARP